MTARLCRWSGLLLAVCLLFTGGWVHAQGTDLGTIRGTVTDSAGAVVVGAKVAIIDAGTGIAVNRVTNSSGDYEAPNLKSGNYRVTISLDGFNTAEITGLELRVGATVRADAKLTPKTL